MRSFSAGSSHAHEKISKNTILKLPKSPRSLPKPSEIDPGAGQSAEKTAMTARKCKRNVPKAAKSEKKTPKSEK